MTGDPDVIARLNDAFAVMLSIEQQAHLQEHLLESTGWKCLSKWFDHIEGPIHADVLHPLLNRVFDLGGIATSRYAFAPGAPLPADQIDAACGSLVQRLGDLYRALNAACQAAEGVDDYVSQDKIHEWLKWTEKRIRKFENRLAKIRAIGTAAFLAEKMG